METKTEFIQIIEPLLTTMGDGLVAVIQSLNQGLQVLSNIVGLIENGVETILKVLSHIPIIGKAAQGALHWMQKDELDKVKGDDLNTNLEELFKEKNVYRKVPAKNSIPRRYLP
jgi:predicted transcriptional regulator